MMRTYTLTRGADLGNAWGFGKVSACPKHGLWRTCASCQPFQHRPVQGLRYALCTATLSDVTQKRFIRCATNLTNVDVKLNAEHVRLWIRFSLPLRLLRKHDIRIAIFWTTVHLIPLRDCHDKTVHREHIVVWCT